MQVGCRLSQLLQHLKVPKKSWHIMVSPNPQKYMGYQSIKTEKYHFHIKLDSNPDIDCYFDHNTMIGMTGNIVSGAYTDGKYSHAVEDPEHFETDWLDIVEKRPRPRASATTTDTGSPTPLRAAMIQLMEKFPKYDLQTEKGVKAAIEDIEGMLKPVATFEDSPDND